MLIYIYNLPFFYSYHISLICNKKEQDLQHFLVRYYSVLKQYAVNTIQHILLSASYFYISFVSFKPLSIHLLIHVFKQYINK
jgi:hypothetical protein